jgi:hypothetical protein
MAKSAFGGLSRVDRYKGQSRVVKTLNINEMSNETRSHYGHSIFIFYPVVTFNSNKDIHEMPFINISLGWVTHRGW